MGQPALKASDHSSRAPRQRRLPILPDSSSFHRKRIKTALMIGAVTLFAILAIASLLCTQKWPFTRKHVVNDLEQATLSTVEIKNFQQTYFPHPGCIAVGLTFRRNQDLRTPPLIAIRRLTIEGSYSGVIGKHVSILRAEGMHVIVPPLGTDMGRSQQKGAGEKETVIGKIIADGALLEFQSRDRGQSPARFAIHQFSLQNWGGDEPMAFRTALGRVTFSNLSFSVPGAMVRMHGTYDLIDQRVNLQGILQMRAKLSIATTGVKSFLVKALDPFLHNNYPRAPFPISITGTYHHPSYHVLTRPEKRASIPQAYKTWPKTTDSSL